MKEFCTLRAKTYSYLMGDDSETKKAKRTKKCVIKWDIMFENSTDCLFNDKIILQSQQRFKSDHEKVYTEDVNKIALSSNDDKRLQTFNMIETYPYGTIAFKVREKEMLTVKDLFLKNYNEISKWSTLMITLMKIKLNIIKIDHMFQVIHTEY